MTKEKSYQYVLYGACIGSVLLTYFCYLMSYERLYDGLIDVIFSLWYYIAEMINPETNNVTATVTALPDIKLEELLPWDWEAIARKFDLLWSSLFNKGYFMAYLQSIANFAHRAAIWLMLAIPLVLLSVVKIHGVVNQPAEYKHGEDTKPLQIFKRIVREPYFAIRDWLSGFVTYARPHRLTKTLFWHWVFNLNIVSMAVEFVAFYFYLAASFDFSNIFIQILKLFVDLIIMFRGLPFILWCFIGIKIFDMIRKRIGYSILNHNEMKNRGFINSLPVVSMACGTMGAKKTTLVTDMVISTEIMFRDKAQDLLFKNDMKLPNFPWQRLEDALRRAIEKGIVYNLATVETWVDERAKRYAFREYPAYVYGYDIVLYRERFDDDLTVKGMFDIVKTYAKLYFIYIVESSLILANYSVRTDSVLMDNGHFPIWNTELFRILPGERSSRHSHIIDFDLFRLGNTIIKNAQKSGALEFGVIGITEIGKERQNSLELKELKKSEEQANQKNDLFNSWLKMARHPGVVDNYTFVKVFTDEQRPESWGADARDLCTIIDISECSDIVLSMPGFLFGDLIYDLFYEKFKDMYYTIRFNRGDNTLFLYLFKNLFEMFLRHYIRIYNRFGVMKMTLGTRAGTMDAEAEQHDYYLAVKKIYSDRFSTDCYSEYFRSRALASKFSLITADEYKGVRASLDELNSQNSYFIRDLNKTFKKEK